jgi:N-acetylglucosamine-6-phosphate deacetylase
VYGRGVLDTEDGDDSLKMFTVAPEVKGVLKAVEEVKRQGGMVCVGHS